MNRRAERSDQVETLRVEVTSLMIAPEHTGVFIRYAQSADFRRNWRFHISHNDLLTRPVASRAFFPTRWNPTNDAVGETRQPACVWESPLLEVKYNGHFISDRQIVDRACTHDLAAVHPELEFALH